MKRTAAPGKNIGTLIFFILLISIFSVSPLKAAEENPAKTVAVLPFALHAGENLAYLQDGLRDMLASRLAANAGVVIVERRRVDTLLQEPGQRAVQLSSPEIRENAQEARQEHDGHA